MNFSYPFFGTVSKLLTTGKCVITKVLVNPSATALEFKIHDGLDANAPIIIHIKDATVDSRDIDFSFPFIFENGVYFEIVGNITDYTVGIQFI